MIENQWTAVDDYLGGLLLPADPILDAAVKAGLDAGLPQIQVSPVQGKFLNLLARIQGARKILEIGTLAGYSTIWLGRALPSDGRLISIEISERHAEVARANLRLAGLAAIAEVRVGPALECLALLDAEKAGPFDLVFIDADKENNPEYVSWALKLSRPGTVIVVDNVVRDGTVIDRTVNGPTIQGVRRMLEMVAREPRLDATALQMVGVKGYDGYAVLLVLR
jgi:predicted O-methyltransferase YrrM